MKRERERDEKYRGKLKEEVMKDTTQSHTNTLRITIPRIFGPNCNGHVRYDR